MTKRYIGDGVYVDFDGYNIVVTTEDGSATTNIIYLEPAVWNGLARYVAELTAKSPTVGPDRETLVAADQSRLTAPPAPDADTSPSG